MGELKEKDIVNHIIQNWDNLFEEEVKFCKKEATLLEDYRCDIVGYIQPKGTTNYASRSNLLFECKYQSNSRDLIYELTKAISLRERIKGKETIISVISDNFDDPHIRKFILENDIHMWQIHMENEKLETLSLEYIETKDIEI